MRYRKTLSTEINCGGNKVLSGMSCKSVTSWVPQTGPSVCSEECQSEQRWTGLRDRLLLVTATLMRWLGNAHLTYKNPTSRRQNLPRLSAFIRIRPHGKVKCACAADGKLLNRQNTKCFRCRYIKIKPHTSLLSPVRTDFPQLPVKKLIHSQRGDILHMIGPRWLIKTSL